MNSAVLLPQNATPQEAALAGAIARISAVPVPIRETYRPQELAESRLPWLAWAMSLDEWDNRWTEAQKRQSIAGSVFVHRHKGTIGAVRRALADLGLGVQLQEWFNQTPAATPYTFRLLVTAEETGITQTALFRIAEVVNSTKNLRSHLSQIVPQAITTSSLKTAGVTCMGANITVKFDENGFALILEGSKYGAAATEKAVDDLNVLMNIKLPATFG